MRFAADKLVALLHRHDALDLRPGGERLQRLMRAFVPDRADHRALDAAHDVWFIAELPNLFENGHFVFSRNVGFENNDHNEISVDHIDRLAAEKRLDVGHRHIEEARSRRAGGPGNVRRDEAVFGREERVFRGRRFDR